MINLNSKIQCTTININYVRTFYKSMENSLWKMLIKELKCEKLLPFTKSRETVSVTNTPTVRMSSHQPLSLLPIKIRMRQLIYYEQAFSYRRISSRSLLFDSCQMISCRRGLNITIDADLVQCYLVSRDSRENPWHISLPNNVIVLIFLYMYVSQCNSLQGDVFIRESRHISR